MQIDRDVLEVISVYIIFFPYFSLYVIVYLHSCSEHRHRSAPAWHLGSVHHPLFPSEHSVSGIESVSVVS